MADVVDAATRSRMMAGIRARDTKPEMIVRRALHKAGFRYRLHVKDLPGKPDIVLPKYKTAIFVHGCFWHGHMCRKFKWPKSREEWWRAKIEGNVARDKKAAEDLLDSGWRLGIVWECALKGQENQCQVVASSLAEWLISAETFFETPEESHV